MKNFKLINYLLIAASSLVFMQCTSDYQVIKGDPGTDGTNGVDGVDGTNGLDGVGVQVCIDCHSDTHRDPIREAWSISTHATGGHERYGSRGLDADEPDPLHDLCSRCHTNEGFIDYAFGGIDAVSTTGYEGATHISCTTCHDMHRSFDFDNDGNDYALRKISPVELETMAYTIDLGGHSNLCVNCHQPRDLTIPTDNGDGTATIVGTRDGPHYSPQSTLLEGIIGAVVTGTEAIPGIGSHPHRAQTEGCITCHMGPTVDGDQGEHTFFPTKAACLQCHSASEFPSAESFDLNGFQTEVIALLDELEVLLLNKGIINSQGRSVPGDYPIGIVNAYWNWVSFRSDHSDGVHNPAYVEALLKNSIESLQN